jgi:hypothetical protein
MIGVDNMELVKQIRVLAVLLGIAAILMGWLNQYFISGCMTILTLQFVMWVWHQQKGGK